MTESFSHDQNFKNLILDYPRQALQFFTPQEATGIDENTIITPYGKSNSKTAWATVFMNWMCHSKLNGPISAVQLCC